MRKDIIHNKFTNEAGETRKLKRPISVANFWMINHWFAYNVAYTNDGAQCNC